MTKKQLFTLFVPGLNLVLIMALILGAGTPLLVGAAPLEQKATENAGAGAPPEGLSSDAWDKIVAQLPPATDSLQTSEVAKLLAGDGEAYDSFGYSVAASGDTVVVGAYDDDDNGSNSGSAYIFRRNQSGGDAWDQVAKLTASDGAADDAFGYSVAISGDTIVVGAYQDDDNGSDSGSAYVFGRNQGGADAWGQVAKLLASDGADNDYFGRSVAISGDTVVVGANQDDDNGSDSGSAYVFQRNQGGADAWGQVAKLLASDGADGDRFGASVAISGDTVVAGAYYDDDNGSNSGSAYVFARNQGGADAWGQVAKLLASDGAIYDYFGRSVAISGDAIAIGAPHYDDEGSAYVFGRNQGGADTWGQVAKLTASDGADEDDFGSSVAISGDTIVVGAYQDGDNGSSSGSAYVFARNEGGADAWGQAAKLLASDGADSDYFGLGITISGNTILVGAYGDDDSGSSSGSAYVFTRAGNTWEETAKPIADDGTAVDYFGYAAAVSGDTAVVGAYGEGGGGSFSGSAYVFERNQGSADAWGQVAKLTADYPAAGDYFGYAVDISGDTIVVGAYGDADIGWASGTAYVFERNTGGADAWGQVTQLIASDGMSGDAFGYAVAISGDTLVVGALWGENGGVCTGSAYVFARNQDGADAWGQVAKLTATDGASYDYFGEAVDISGDTIVVGARSNDDAALGAGAAYVFARNQGGANVWGQVAQLTASDAATYDWFGKTVAISQDTVFIGMYHYDGSSTEYGSVYVFERNHGGADTWGEVTKITAPDGATYDCFACALAASGDTLAVGASYEDSSGSYSGSAYIFQRNQGGADTWGQVAQLTASDAADNDEFGAAVAISNGTVVAGAYQDDDLGSASGSAYVYYWDYIPPADLTIAKSVTPPSAAPGERITYTLSISNAGGSTATGVVITDTIPAEVVGTSAIASGLVITQVSGSRYAWNVADLAAGAEGVITITGVVKVPTGAGVLTNTATITTTSTDSNPGNNTSSAGVSVLNIAPAANDITLAADEDYPLVSKLSANDPNGDAITYGLTTAPVSGTVVLINTATGKFVYTPTNRLVSYSDAFTYIVTDTGSLTDTAAVTINVIAYDDPPVVSNIPNQRTDPGVPVGPIPFTVGDPDTPVETLTLDRASSNTALVPAANIAFGGSGANRTVTVTPTVGMTGTAIITVTAQDGTCTTSLAIRRPSYISHCGYDVFVLVAGEGNSPPEFSSEPVTEATQEVAYTYNITAADLDAGDALTITAVAKPAWLTLIDHHDRTATLGGTPHQPAVGDHLVRLRVVDNAGAVGMQTFTVTVANINDPPLARNDITNTNEYTPKSVDVLANDDDLDGDPISIAALGLPLYGSAAISGTAVLYTPTNRMANYAAVFTYTISDGELTDEATVTVTVAANNDPPVISNIPNQMAKAGKPLGPIAFTVGDPDTPPVALALTKDSSDPAVVPLDSIAIKGSGINRTITLTPTTGISGTSLITITVSDGTSSDYDVFLLTARVNNPPNFASTPITTATQGVAYTYHITATDADAGDLLIISALAKPDWLIFVGHPDRTAILGGVPNNSDVGEHLVALRVRDYNGALDTQVFTITVSGGAANQPPVANAGQDQTVTVGKLATLDGSGSSDPDGNLPLAWLWTQTGGSPMVLLSSATISQPTFTAPGEAGLLTFTLVVTDSLGLASAPDVVVITVTQHNIYLPIVLRNQSSS